MGDQLDIEALSLTFIELKILNCDVDWRVSREKLRVEKDPTMKVPQPVSARP
jgi:hypothetical protein